MTAFSKALLSTDLLSYCRRHLNLLMKGMEPLREVLGDRDDAAVAMHLSHVWREQLASAVVPYDAPPDMAAAQMLLENRLSLLNSIPFDLGEPVDWRRFSDDHPQLTSHLAYMYWLKPLAEAYEFTGEERYAEKFLQLIESFLDYLPYGSCDLPWNEACPAIYNDRTTCNNGETSAVSGQWISLACHSRIEAWLPGLGRIRDSAALTFPRLLRILDSLMFDHAQLIVSNPRENTPNQYFSNSLSLLKLAVTFPEFHAAESYFQVAWSRVERCLNVFVLPDGALVERSLNYNIFFPDQIRSIEWVMRNGPVSWRESLRASSRRAALVLARLTTPDGRLLPVAKTHTDSLLPEIRRWGQQLDIPECLRLAGELMPEPDCPPSFYLPYGGYAILRDSWSQGATQLFFKSSGPSPGHVHEDCLNIGLFSSGKNVLTEASSYNYNDTTSQDRAMNEYCASTRGHNGISVDGLGQNRTQQRFRLSGRTPHEIPNWSFFHRRLQNRAAEGLWFAVVEGCYEDGFGVIDSPILVSHFRQIVWIKSLGFLVVDHLTPIDVGMHRYCSHWHLDPRFRPEQVRWNPEGRSLETVSGQGDIQLSLHVSDELSCSTYYGEDEPCRGWQCLSYGQRTPKVDVEFSFSLSGPTTIMTLLRPLAVGDDREPFHSFEIPDQTVRFVRNKDEEIVCRIGLDGELEISVRGLMLGERALLLPARKEGRPTETHLGATHFLESLAVDENPRLRKYFDIL